jgi:hypothetical protein
MRQDRRVDLVLGERRRCGESGARGAQGDETSAACGNAPRGGAPRDGVPPEGVPPEGVPPEGVPPEGVPADYHPLHLLGLPQIEHPAGRGLAHVDMRLRIVTTATLAAYVAEQTTIR